MNAEILPGTHGSEVIRAELVGRIRWSSLNVIAWLAFDPWGRWFPAAAAVAQCTVWSLRVVVYPPFFDEDTRLLHGVEDFTDE